MAGQRQPSGEPGPIGVASAAVRAPGARSDSAGLCDIRDKAGSSPPRRPVSAGFTLRSPLSRRRGLDSGHEQVHSTWDRAERWPERAKRLWKVPQSARED